MEVNSPHKRLHKHALPVVMVAAAILVLPVIVFSRYNSGSPHDEAVLARGLVTRVLHVRPAAGGLAKIALSGSNLSQADSGAGPSLPIGIGDAGSTARSSLEPQSQ